MVHDIRIVTETELRQSVTLDLDLIDAMETAFVSLASGQVQLPPGLTMPLAEGDGEVDIETARIEGLESYAVKILSGLRDTPDVRRPGRDGLVVQLSACTGAVEAVFLDNGYLTDLRSAAAGAVAARYLAPEDVTTAGVIGAGTQASLQIKAARLVRPFERVLVYGRNPQNAAACAADLGATLDVEVEVTTDPEVLVKRSQLVVTATSAQTPVLMAEWLHNELHVTAVGTDQAKRNEVDPFALARADLFVCDHADRCGATGELHAARRAGLFVDVTPPELGDIVTGRHRGRGSPAEITICDLIGTGALDTAIVAHAAARINETGTVIRARHRPQPPIYR